MSSMDGAACWPAVTSTERTTVDIYVVSVSVIDMNEVITAGQRRTAAARAKRSRIADESKAARLRERGWACIPPEAIELLPDEFRLLVRALNRSTPPAT